MGINEAILNTCIQYGVLGIIGFIAIRNFVTQSCESNKITRDLLNYIISEKRDRSDEIIESLYNIMKIITKDKETIIKCKYEILTELQGLNLSLKTIESDKEQADKLYFKIQEIENAIIKSIRSDENQDEGEK